MSVKNLFILLAALIYLNGCNVSLIDSNKNQANENQVITYTYQDYFSLDLPTSWENNYTVDEPDNPYIKQLIFHNTLNKEAGWGGILFFINFYEKAIWEEQEADISGAMGFRLLGEANDYIIALISPSDVQYNINDESLADSYDAMFKDIDDIVKSFKVL